MSKYIDADKLKKLIDEKWKELADKNVKIGGGKWDAEISTYLSVLRLITSLQQEQSQVADASKMERLNVDAIRDWSMRYAPDIRDAIEATAYHFWDLAIYSIKEK